MKALYLDSGALIKLYVVEPGSDFVADAIQAAQILARDHTSKILCRTLDVLHVALALRGEADALVSGDKRQIALCRAIDLNVIEVPTRES